MKLREEEFYEQYHQHGGTTIIPTEIFNELYDDATEEIERQKEIIRQLDIKNLELTTIIKEAINYIDDNTYYKDHKGHINIDDLYIILQKGSEKIES